MMMMIRQNFRILKSPEKLRVVKSNRRTNSLAFSPTPRERKSYNLPFLARATRSEEIRNHPNSMPVSHSLSFSISET
ncbi:hypothetical protein CDAR_321101 [Caerostris darwini]|uniref:Uncharacterized protein n=1 Tax=Caerostris darwini TaxID=1538125 RepID=A0AAV4WYD3_9ARAC|nr:hypothetical protein CDAR_321101 [Caerostris darwini]